MHFKHRCTCLFDSIRFCRRILRGEARDVTDGNVACHEDDNIFDILQ